VAAIGWGEAARSGTSCILLPKVDTEHDVAFVDRLLAQIESASDASPIGVHIIVETAAGLANVERLAGFPTPRLRSIW